MSTSTFIFINKIVELRKPVFVILLNINFNKSVLLAVSVILLFLSSSIHGPRIPLGDPVNFLVITVFHR